MTTIDFITGLLCKVDDVMCGVPKHRQASLHLSQTVTLGTGCGVVGLKGVGERVFYRWPARDYRSLFGHLPERTRLIRLVKTYRAWTQRSPSVAQPSPLGVADAYGIQRLHPRCEGRSAKQLGNKGLSDWRWIIGVRLGFVLNHLVGLVCTRDYPLASVTNKDFRPLVAQFADETVVLVDTGFMARPMIRSI